MWTEAVPALKRNLMNALGAAEQNPVAVLSHVAGPVSTERERLNPNMLCNKMPKLLVVKCSDWNTKPFNAPSTFFSLISTPVPISSALAG